MDVSALLQSHGEDAPSGEDLEYDPAFTELEIAAQPGEERQVGDQIIEAEDPDYKETSKLAEAIMERSHDVRAGIFMAEAQLRLTGFAGFAKATSYVRGCLEEYWDSCHPQLDEDDGDATMRINAILGLADDRRIIKGVRKAPLTKSKMFGMLSLRDIAVAEGEMTPTADMDDPPDAAQIAAAFQDTDPDALTEIAAAVKQAKEDVEAISEKFDEETPGEGPDLDPLVKLLKQALTRLNNATGGDADDDEDATDDDEDTDTGNAPAAAPVGGGGGVSGINSRNDVSNALDRIMAYYERAEPSSPVPILLERAKRLVHADFLTIMKDMAPDGVDNVNLIGGIEEE